MNEIGTLFGFLILIGIGFLLLMTILIPWFVYCISADVAQLKKEHKRTSADIAAIRESLETLVKIWTRPN
jgi:uncharacterized protein YpmS